jgi:hypothetical protein
MMLVQILLLFFAICWAGFSLKTRFVPLPNHAFPVLLRNYGFLLIAVPAGWCAWAVFLSRRPNHGTGSEALIGVSGVVICLAIILLGWLAARQAWSAPPMEVPARTSASAGFRGPA